MIMPPEEHIYSESEILQVLKGLMYVYWTKPWWTRWLYKPWLSALQTTALILCGDKAVIEAENDQLLEDIDKHLSE